MTNDPSIPLGCPIALVAWGVVLAMPRAATMSESRQTSPAPCGSMVAGRRFT